MTNVYLFEFTDRPNTSIEAETLTDALEQLVLALDAENLDALRDSIIGVRRAPAQAFTAIAF